MGALEFKPALKTGDAKPAALEMSELVEAARRVLCVELWRDNDPVWGMPADEDGTALPSELARLIAVGTSAGGARAKAVVGYNERTNAFLSGQFDLPDGYRHWIIKFDIESLGKAGPPRDYGRIEYACYLMACACGIEMAPSRLYEAGGRAHFMTQRFDRIPIEGQGVAWDNGKLHMQTLCGIAQMDYKQRGAHDYNQLFMTLDELGLGYQAVDQVFLRMVFNVCAANNDDHTKNYSFLMDSEGVWSLAPAYDLTHAYRKDSLWVSRHLMSVNGRFEDIRRADILNVAKQFHVAAPQRLIEDVLASVRHWPEFANQAGVSEETTNRIQADIESFSALVG
jgi:serine/threonine-protein kinase HipA